ncbi:MAG TPA: serine protease [Polyangiaceae bacterium]|nr:serine protease [Polyangiaceae bacterium]
MGSSDHGESRVSPARGRRAPVLAGAVLAASLPGSLVAAPGTTPPSPAPAAAAKAPAVVPGPAPAVLHGAHGAGPTPALVAGKPPVRSARPPIAPPLPNSCPGEYADNFSALASKVRRLETQLASYTFCIRTTATYECPSYGVDGDLVHKRTQVVAHGTAFAYRRGGAGTLLLTNQHVADWPIVTDDDHPAEDVPAGCRRVNEQLSIVENEADSYERDDIPLSRVVADPLMDIAVLSTASKLPVLPWKIGHSARLKERNIVDVRGFPLGVFKATNVGKVVSSYDHDTYKDWDHDDFVVDALLSPGNSGSPVLAISCKTGEFELVGVYHAGYTRGSALNAVVGIDQIRGLITTLKPTPRRDPNAQLDVSARARLSAAAQNTLEPFFPLGSLTASLRTRSDGVFFFELFNRSFPLRTFPIAVLEDVPTLNDDEFGALGRVWFGGRQGLKEYDLADLDAATRPQLVKLLDGLRRGGLAAFALREADQDANQSRERFERTERLEKALRRTSTGQKDIALAISDIAERLAPKPDEATVALESLLVEPSPREPGDSAESGATQVSTTSEEELPPNLNAGD